MIDKLDNGHTNSSVKLHAVTGTPVGHCKVITDGSLASGLKKQQSECAISKALYHTPYIKRVYGRLMDDTLIDTIEYKEASIKTNGLEEQAPDGTEGRKRSESDDPLYACNLKEGSMIPSSSCVTQ